ncbi:MAG: hypothetical protein ACK5LP_07705 [Campylobacteraceae bacterium]
MPKDKILNYIEELKAEKPEFNPEAIFDDLLDVKSLTQKGEIRADVKNIIKERLYPKSEVQKYVAKTTILHSGKTYKAGEDVSMLDEESIRRLVTLKAVTIDG